MKKSRIYVCHTYYHVFVSILKEFALPKEEQGQATLVLSKMSTDFQDLDARIKKQGIFEDVVWFDEKPFWYFDELAKYKKDYKNFAVNLISRMIFTKKYAKCEAPYIPVNFREYKDIYVFCDSDPIGYYLSANRIYYHAVEDGLNNLMHYDAARYDNRGNFKIKALLASWNLIFIQSGYSKYCIDMEVNQLEGLKYYTKKYKEVSRAKLFERTTRHEKDMIVDIFVKDKNKLFESLSRIGDNAKACLILTEPLCDLESRKQIFRDLVDMYSKEMVVCLKPHPRDELDYTELFPNLIVFEKKVPMEVLNCLGEKFFDKVISVLTDINEIYFAKETERLGPDFMDKYEEASVHRQNEQI